MRSKYYKGKHRLSIIYACDDSGDSWLKSPVSPQQRGTEGHSQHGNVESARLKWYSAKVAVTLEASTVHGLCYGLC